MMLLPSLLQIIGTSRSVADKRPAKRGEISDQLNTLLNGPPAAATVTNVNSAIEAIRALDASDNAGGGVTSTTEFKQVNFPLATLFQSIVKAVERGTEVIPDQNEMLDPASGKKYIPFPKATKASCDANLMYSIHIFVVSVTALKKEAPQVYHTFSNEVRRACVVNNIAILRWLTSMPSLSCLSRHVSLVLHVKRSHPWNGR